jgi:hypothetical protein
MEMILGVLFTIERVLLAIKSVLFLVKRVMEMILGMLFKIETTPKNILRITQFKKELWANLDAPNL